MLCASGYSQTDITKPEDPVIRYVTVVPDQNYIDISWIKSPSSDVKNYVLYHQSTSGQFIAIDTIHSKDSTHYLVKTSVRPDLKSESFALAAQDSADNLSAGTFKKYHSSVHLSATYDPCNVKIGLKWNAYFGWPTVVKYRIWCSVNGAAFSLLDSTLASSLDYTHSPLTEKTEYRYSIEAISAAGETSLSNADTIAITYFTDSIAVLPVSVKVNTANQTDLVFDVRSRLSYDSYLLLRASSPDGTYDTLQKQLPAGTLLAFRDTFTSDPLQYYRIAAKWAQCSKLSYLSDVTEPLVLTAQRNHTKIDLSWPSYSFFNGILKEYRVYIQIEGKEPELIETTQATSYVYDMAGKDYEESSDHICFFVEGEETADPDNVNLQLVSDRHCFLIDTEINMPEAFTPNNDGLNDKIRPVFNRRPLEYVYIVYDRWGKKIFETHSPDEGWDGRSNLGKADEGIYMYNVIGTGFNGKKFDKVGYFSLLYP